MLQKEEKIAVILLLMALSSLAIAAWAIGGFDQGTAANTGSGVSVEGMILGLNPTKSGGNLIIQLDSTSADIFIAQDSGAQEILGKVKIGDRIWVKGRLTEYQGSKEIQVDSARDVEVIAANGK
ncbi:MAG: OB-fold nucleic acid binding domain-containing protein [Methanotrichaceae archaeon]